MKYLAIFFLSVTLLLAGTLQCVIAAENNIVVFSFQKGANGSLQLSKNSPESIKLSYDPSFSFIIFDQEQKPGEYQIHLYDVTGADILKYNFSGESGVFQYVIPYFPTVISYKIFRTTDNALVLEGSLREFSSCNANQICEFELKETMDTCLADCANGNTQYSQETTKTLDENGGVIRDPQTGDVVLRKAIPASLPPVDVTIDPGDQDIASDATVSQVQSQQRLVILISAGFILVGASLVLYLWYRKRRT